MKKYLFLIYVAILSISSSCNESSVKNASEKQNIADDSYHSDAVDEPIEKNNFPVVDINGGEFQEENANQANFTIAFGIKNQSNTIITQIELIGFLKVVFQDGTSTFYPYEIHDETEDEYLNRVWHKGVRPVVTQSVNTKTPWKPNAIYKFMFRMPEDIPNIYKLGVYKSAFQRTPKEAAFVFKYKAIGIDGEYTDVMRYDVLDSWKRYQERLGLR